MKLDEKEVADGLSDEKRILRMDAKDEFGRAIEMEGIMWKQKTRVQWLKEGDENSTLFFLTRWLAADGVLI